MKARLDRWLDELRTGFWFVPCLMLLLSACLALALLHVDQRVDPGIGASIAWAYSGSPEGARSLLSTIAGSMITAASVTFSLASVALSIASQQYGSRVLRNFLRDRITQVLLGTFVSTFIYCVLVVRTIRGSDFSGGFVPAISVTVAIVLSLISLVLLVFFVHHVSTSIQASHIVSVISKDLFVAIPTTRASMPGRPYQAKLDRNALMKSGTMETVTRDGGYLQSLDVEGLFVIATSNDLVIEVLVKAGDHCVPGEKVARIWGKTMLKEDELRHILKSFLFGSERTALQDIRYQFQQLTEVVVRALSPGINDPFTAINGLDALANSVLHLARQPRETANRQDSEGSLRLILKETRISEILEATLGHIAIYAYADGFVMARLHRVLDLMEPYADEGTEHAKVQKLRADLIAGAQSQ